MYGAGGPSVWEPVAELPAGQAQVIVPTLPGFHPEDGVIDYSDKLYVDYLETIRHNLGIQQWAVAGLSLGGRAALNYALQHRGRVSHLIPVSSAGLHNLSNLFRVPGIREVSRD